MLLTSFDGLLWPELFCSISMFTNYQRMLTKGVNSSSDYSRLQNDLHGEYFNDVSISIRSTRIITSGE